MTSVGAESGRERSRGGAGGASRRRWPWLAGGLLAWLAICVFLARLAYVTNWMLDAGRSAVIVKERWFGPTIVNFANVRGVVASVWDQLGGTYDPLVVLPFNSPVVAWAVLALLALAGLLCLARFAGGPR